MTSAQKKMVPWLLAPFLVGACVQIVGIEEPIPIEGKPDTTSSSSGSGSGSTSSGSTGGDPSSPWIGWRMPNPASAGLPNPSGYSMDAANAVVYDKVTGLFWQQNVDAGMYTWDEARGYCTNLDYGGYTDWRLPWRIELVSLIDYTRKHPAIDPIFANAPEDEFWSNSGYADVNDYAWTVTFDYGDTQTQTIMTPARVRCVR